MGGIKTYLTNRPFLLNILAQHEDVIDLSIVNIINNVGLYREAKTLYDKLKPISISLDKLQGEKSNIADSCEEWMKLLQLDEREMSPKQNSATIQTGNHTYSLPSQHDQSEVHGIEAFL